MINLAGATNHVMKWNNQPIPYQLALQIGWNLPQDVVGAGVYGGIVAREKESGKILIGDEWPEDNLSPPAHNPTNAYGPYLDFSKLTSENRGYTKISIVIQSGNVSELEKLFMALAEENEKKKLANLVMTGGARPLHMCGMGRGRDTSNLIKVLIDNGAEVNALDNYKLTPMDRLASNWCAGSNVLRQHGALPSRKIPMKETPNWEDDTFAYKSGIGEVDSN